MRGERRSQTASLRPGSQTGPTLSRNTLTCAGPVSFTPPPTRRPFALMLGSYSGAQTRRARGKLLSLVGSSALGADGWLGDISPTRSASG
jgi:hypothetical protein